MLKIKRQIFKKGFTLIEILLVITIVVVLTTLVIIVINPANQRSQLKNAQRRSDVNKILNAIYQYSADNSGKLPSFIPVLTDCFGSINGEICKTKSDCFGLVDLSVLTDNELYLTSMPTDPAVFSGNGTGYRVIKDDDNRITVCAPKAQFGEIISVSR